MKKKIHFIGIGGIGMSALAQIMVEKGATVSGSDLTLNNLTEDLAGRGVTIFQGHASGHIPEDANLVVVSSCIRDSNPEMIKARELDIQVITRGELLRLLMSEAPVSIAVTGTHGKTTTSSLISYIMQKSGRNPTFVLGGEVREMGGNAKCGGEDILVAEVDESDGFFRKIGCTHGLITNVEREHMENYGTIENLHGAYREFAGRVSGDGMIFYNGEDRVLSGLVDGARARTTSFGIEGDFDVTCEDQNWEGSISFELFFAGSRLGRIESSLLGRHNLMNILGAAAVSIEAGVGVEDIASAVRTFPGVSRRFDVVGSSGGIEVIEDYAHHPTELAAVIRAAKGYTKGRVVAVFQPHRHSRTNDLAEDFLGCFSDADVLIMTDVYSAHEDPTEGVGIRDIWERMDKKDFEMFGFVEKDMIPGYISKIAKENDTVLILGAGDIREIALPVLKEINEARNDNG
ncbi:MAG: UDP-N-acetylmuramate--L-alanine ligase [Candidatus Tantalella remota]|nr:UDP-N-acetylmuramate--L-alanine ligase [Candidatus Tantalella remota]